MLLKILTPFDIIEDGVNVTQYFPGEFDVTNEATIEVALRAGWAEKSLNTKPEVLKTEPGVVVIDPKIEAAWNSQLPE